MSSEGINLNLEPILNQLSVKYQLPKEEIERIVAHNAAEIKRYMSQDDCPNILINNLGRFRVSIGVLKNRIIKLKDNILTYEEPYSERELKTVKNKVYRLDKLLQVYKRKIKEEKEPDLVNIQEVERVINEKKI